jgi:hypothetical protein
MKETANDLINQFKSVDIEYQLYAGAKPEKFPLNNEEAKQCAIIALRREIELLRKLENNYGIILSGSIHEREKLIDELKCAGLV